MADILPFRGLLYNPNKIRNISKVVTPPYDVISHKQLESYYKLNKFNIIKLILPKGKEEKYKKSASALNKWMKKNILVRDNGPNLYIIKEEFVFNGEKKERTSFMCLVNLEEFKNGSIFPHEEIRTSPKKDRFKLLKTCRANLCPIFGLYIDKKKDINKTIKKEINGKSPETKFSITETVSNDKKIIINHKMWKVQSKQFIKNIVSLIKNKKIIIADGHHRYEAALTFKDNYRFVMMQLFNIEDDGIIILPAHRLVKGLTKVDRDNLEKNIANNFLIKKTNKKNMFEQMKKLGNAKKIFGVYNKKNGFRLLSFQKKTNELDVNVIHNTILRNVSDISYTIDVNEAINGVKNNVYDYAFFLNPTKIKEVEEITIKGRRMPGKSTYFFPKLITGLIINKF